MKDDDLRRVVATHRLQTFIHKIMRLQWQLILRLLKPDRNAEQ